MFFSPLCSTHHLPNNKLFNYLQKHFIFLNCITIYNIALKNQVKWILFNHFIIKIFLIYKSYHINTLQITATLNDKIRHYPTLISSFGVSPTSYIK